MALTLRLAARHLRRHWRLNLAVFLGFLLSATFLAALPLLAGCGQRGPLYLPETGAQTAGQAAVQGEDEEDEEEENEGESG